MAEHGAHLTSSSVSEASVPSIFEVLAQESLSATLHPALGHAVRVFAEKYPEQCGVLLRHYDEIYLFCDMLVQSYYLKNYGGSFAENFYGLKRAVTGSLDSTLFPRRSRIRALLCLVLIPYIRHKLNSLYENLMYQFGESGRKAFLQKSVSIRVRLASLYLMCYPYVSSAWEMVTLSYQLTYMLRQGQWHSPGMHLSGTRLTHLTEDDQSLSSGNTSSGQIWTDMSLSERLGYVVKMGVDMSAVAVSTGLSVSVFFLQFLDWWYASDASSASLTALPVPLPPKDEKLKDVSCSMCPLCRRERVNSTALAVSGYVFCYTCINEHIKRRRCCPVTGLTATDEHLVKIYEQIL